MNIFLPCSPHTYCLLFCYICRVVSLDFELFLHVYISPTLKACGSGGGCSTVEIQTCHLVVLWCSTSDIITLSLCKFRYIISTFKMMKIKWYLWSRWYGIVTADSIPAAHRRGFGRQYLINCSHRLTYPGYTSANRLAKQKQPELSALQISQSLVGQKLYLLVFFQGAWVGVLMDPELPFPLTLDIILQLWCFLSSHCNPCKKYPNL